MAQKLVEIGKNLLESALALTAQETLLVVYDETKIEIADFLLEAGRQIGAETIGMSMTEREKSGQEPPLPVAAAMKTSDVVLCITNKSLTHTQAKKDAAQAGARVATMPGITLDMFAEGAIQADYNLVEKRTNHLTEKLSKAQKVVLEKADCQLSFSIAGRFGVPSTGIYRNSGEAGNLPSGEAYIAPLEGTANGSMIIDGSFVGVGKLEEPIKVIIENGHLQDIEGYCRDIILDLLGPEAGRNLAEFGIGTNEAARITGNVLEDEKVYQTVHLAFGSNKTFGGTVEAGVHLDGVILSPTFYLDDEKVMEHGEFLTFP